MNIVIRNVKADDFATLHSLAAACKPLDLHTPYTYWVITHYYAEFSFIMEVDGKPVGFITALTNGECGFIWQIGILKEYRGKKLSSKLIDCVFNRFSEKGIRSVQVTISPDNENSFNAFSQYCKAKEYSFQRLTDELIESEGAVHTETLYQITI